ncbi:HNH endonuclease [Corynebacterium yudongzhengii]|uniref:HNH endonuclease n=1 Tax=Corynebacterium yudongzhengii TaxID=2080740 RepID=A0A2U1T957_9CORY|nr:HNH endonuclease signature motif containing protein [Corynebacterium yudongzhengii]AWB82469.1 HNH endonuclease [Corynebacterium yudongzhengii]PWC02475.1 HNH endonuclease [Corynebacterium yudongzhengii]
MHPLLDALTALNSRGAELLRAIAGRSARQLVVENSLPRTEAQRLVRLSETYCGPTRYTRVQRDALDAAERNGHGVATLAMIERYVRRAREERQQWPLRLELCRVEGNFEAVRDHARRRVEELNEPKEPPTPTPGVSVRHNHRAHTTTLALTVDTRTGADLIRGLEAQAKDAPRREALGEAMLAQLRGTGTAIPRTRYTPLVVVSARDLRPILGGEGDDIMLASDDGTLVSGAELVNDRMTEHGFVGLFHPVSGGLNLYRTDRFASEAQRIMARAENPICPWPGCSMPASRCQIHHLEAFARGGKTNMEDLSCLCGYHNGANDDDPARPRNGRLERVNGHIVWRPPRGGPPILSDHPVGNLGAMRILD